MKNKKAIVIICIAAALLICVIAGIFAEKGERIVGKDIAKEEITEFYYTYAASTYPPEYQRYHFYVENGKYMFYHEKREGNTWPLGESDISKSGTLELSEEEWSELFEYLKEGKVEKRGENIDGGRSISTYLYWDKDKDIYQQFTFATAQKENMFEEFCAELTK